MEWVIAEKGEYTEVAVTGSGRMVMVPRHFIALHGFCSNGDPHESWVTLCGFEEVK